MKTQSIESIKPNNQLKEASNLVSVGIKLQEIKEFSKAKTSMLQGIERIKKVLIKDNSTDKEIVFEYYSLFEKFLQNVNNEEENDKLAQEFKSTFNEGGPAEFIEGNCLKDIYLQYMSKNNFAEIDFYFLPLKILQKIGDYMETGFYFSKNFYVRKEIWYQNNGKIDGLHQKFEAYKAIFEKIDNLMILSKNNVINIENIDKFCDMLVDIQNNFSKEYDYIKPCKENIKNDLGQNGFYKRFSEISNKIKNNLLSTKLFSKPEYVQNLSKMITKTRDIEMIFSNKNLKKVDPEKLKEKKICICMFFYNTVIKLTFQDIKDLTLRFLKKKFLTFENR